MKQLPKRTDLFGNEEYFPTKALTWKPPFGTAMLHGKVETREWNTDYRGLVLICNGLESFSDNDLLSMCNPDQLNALFDIWVDDPTAHLFGHAIAVGALYKVTRMTPGDEFRTFVKYNENLWCHEYRNVRRIQPFEFKGGQKWTDVYDQNILKKIVFL